MSAAAVVTEAMGWAGTPYHHHGRVKGAGVDCAMLLAEVFERAGVVERVEPGFYPVDWHLHRTEEMFLEWLQRAGGRPVQTPALADVGVFRFGRTFSHGAIVIDVQPVRVVHAYLRRGVIVTALDEEPLRGRVVQWWRVLPEASS